ncbi:MAG: hypothetical protein QGG64_06680 [Candidatus Latescibacteria bacterium]|jgi:multidrug efflux pump subunit AcrA (membrane-fusion protein)|nr:hypothetical protein [Candidatus Latescibacterota bacterium]
MRIFLLVCLALVGCGSDSAPPPETPPVPVRTAAVKEQIVQTVVPVSGITASRRTMRLGFKVGGVVGHVFVRRRCGKCRRYIVCA